MSTSNPGKNKAEIERIEIELQDAIAANKTALIRFQKAGKMYETLGDATNASKCNFNAATIAQMQQDKIDFDHALEKHLLILRTFDEYSIQRADYLHTIGTMCAQREKYDLALKYLYNAVDIYEVHHSPKVDTLGSEIDAIKRQKRHALSELPTIYELTAGIPRQMVNAWLATVGESMDGKPLNQCRKCGELFTGKRCDKCGAKKLDFKAKLKLFFDSI